MSNKRQKLETIPCAEHARELLLEHLIPDLAGKVIDEYVPFVHGFLINFGSGGTQEWNRLHYPCSEDCKFMHSIQFQYKERSGKVRGPFDFETLHIERTMRAGKLYEVKELFFTRERDVVTFRITDAKSIATPEPWTCNTGQGIDEMVDIAFVEAEKFLARHVESTNVIGSQSK